jgi:hypothetical protein
MAFGGTRAAGSVFYVDVQIKGINRRGSASAAAKRGKSKAQPALSIGYTK